MRLSRTDLVPVLAIVAGGAIGASLSFSFLGSRSEDVLVFDPPMIVQTSVPPATVEPLIWVEVPRNGSGVAARAAHLVREQHYIEAAMDRLTGNYPDLQTQKMLLFKRKEAMHDEIVELESEIARLKGQAQTDERDSSWLDEAASTIEEDELKERVRYSRVLISVQDREYARQFEAETSRIVEELQEELASVTPDLRSYALFRARQLVRGLKL